MLAFVLAACALALLWHHPYTVYRIESTGERRARCRIETRFLGLVPRSDRTIDGVVTASSTSHDDAGSPNGTLHYTLTFGDEENREIYRSEEGYLVGATSDDVKAAIESINYHGGRPVTLWHAPWHVLLGASGLGFPLGVGTLALLGRLGLPIWGGLIGFILARQGMGPVDDVTRGEAVGGFLGLIGYVLFVAAIFGVTALGKSPF